MTNFNQNRNYQNQLNSKNTPLTIHNFRQEVQKIKTPHLNQVKQTTSKFHQTVIAFQDKIQTLINLSHSSNQLFKQQKIIQNIQQFSSERKSSNQPQELFNKYSSNQRYNYKNQKLQTEEDKIDIIPQATLKQWQPSNEERFLDYQDVQKKYNDIFQKKLPAKKSTYNPSQDYKKQQISMLNRIFEQIKDKNDSKTVTIKAILKFFQEYQLFYSFYNIPADDIQNILKEAARTYSNRMTKQQFVNLLIHDRPIVIGCHKSIYRQLQKKCILDEQSWKDLKSIFDTLDTFGNETINVFGFFHRVKTNPSLKGLLDVQAIQFPQIGRKYSLRKIIFNFENKYDHQSKTIKWNEIEDFIFNFSHKQQPSIDYIFDKQIQKAQISRQTNYFLINQEIIQAIKNIFKRCPKYCHNFVKVKFFTQELFQSNFLKGHRNVAVRIISEDSQNQYVNLLDAIKLLLRSDKQYIDLDQALQFFTIKGPHKNDFNIQFNKIFQQQSSQQEDIHQKISKRKIKKIKSLENLKKINVKKGPNQKFKKVIYDTTTPVQFKLHKKDKPSIRQIKVQKMIQENYNKDTEQLNNKFKANPIPASINPERYKAYVKTMQKKKDLIFQQLNKQGQKERKVLQYLKSNTKLFEKKKQPKQFQNSSNKKEKAFQSKPLPWFIKTQMLQSIIKEKEARRKMILEQTKDKYQQYWYYLKYDASGRTEQQQNQSSQSLQAMLSEKKQQKINMEKQLRTIKPKPIPDFKQLQKKFAQQLKSKKQKYQPTIPKQFNLTSPKAKPIFQEQQLKQKLKTIKSNKSPNRYRSISPSIKIHSTQKYQAMVQFNQNKRIQNDLKKQIMEEQEKEKKIKKQNFAKYMMKSFKKVSNNSSSLKDQTKQKLNKFKKQQQYLNKMNDRELGKMYARVLQRPFLFENNSGDKQNSQYQNQQKNANQMDFNMDLKKKKKVGSHKFVQSNFPELPKQLIPNQNGEIEFDEDISGQPQMNFDQNHPQENQQDFYDFEGVQNQSF